jgi:asparagine synthase (glutamine-hydrolysing)
MCGIAGFIQPSLAEESLIRKMLTAQSHRGPDSTDCWVDKNAALGHNRLSIIDLSTNGNQPMFTPDGRYGIVFNGEIYNYQALKTDLQSKGYSFKSGTDTETILYGYEVYGIKVLDKMNGMFALAIYDRLKQSFFLARDRFGKKPLFYYHKGETLVFSSELQALLTYPQLALSLNEAAVDQFLSLQYIPSPHTIYKEIKQLGASEYLMYEKGQIRIQSYYSLRPKSEYAKLDYEEAKKLVKEKVSEAVRKRLMADVPLGAFLSGGIDSSIVTALLAQQSSKQLTTVSVGFDQAAYSELDKARSMAKRYQTDHHEYVLSLDEAQKSVEEVISYYTQPFGDSSAIPMYFLSRTTRKHVTVALSGDGGDELFCGYQRYHLDLKMNRLQTLLPNFLLKAAFDSFQLIPPKKNVPIERNWPLGLKRLAQVIRIDSRASILRWGSYFSFEQKKQLYREYAYPQDEAVRYLTHLFEQSKDFQDFSLRTQYADLFSYAQGDYLVKADIAAMRNSLEVRCPFLDYELAELVFSLNPQFSRKGMSGKRILKEAFAADLTPEVLQGSKQGFSIPMVDWFKSTWLDILRSYLQSPKSFCRQHFRMEYIEKLIKEHIHNQDDHSKRLYVLLVLEVWTAKNSIN